MAAHEDVAGQRNIVRDRGAQVEVGRSQPVGHLREIEPVVTPALHLAALPRPAQRQTAVAFAEVEALAILGLDAPALRVAGIGEIAHRRDRAARVGQRAAVVDLRDQVVELGIIARYRKIAAPHRAALETDLVTRAVFVAEQHLHRARCAWVGQARVEAAGAIAAPDLGIGEDVGRQLVRQRRIVGEIVGGDAVVDDSRGTAGREPGAEIIEPRADAAAVVRIAQFACDIEAVGQVEAERAVCGIAFEMEPRGRDIARRRVGERRRARRRHRKIAVEEEHFRPHQPGPPVVRSADMDILREIVGRIDHIGRAARVERGQRPDFARGARTRQFGDTDRIIVEVIFAVPLAERGRRGEVGAAKIDAHDRLQPVDALRRPRCGVPRVAETILNIAARKAGRAGRNEDLVMNGRRRQPLRLCHYDGIDRAALQADLSTQAMPLLPVEIDVVVGVVEKALVLFDQIAADPRRDPVAQRHIHRALQLQAVVLEPVSHAGPTRQVEFGLGRYDVDRAADRVAAVERTLRPAQHLDAADVEHIEAREVAPADRTARDIGAAPIEADARVTVGRARRRRRADRNFGRDRRAEIVEAHARLVGEEFAASRRPAAIVERRRVDHRCRGRHIGQAFLAAPRGDDDRAVIARFRRRIGRKSLGSPILGGSGRGRRHPERGRTEKKLRLASHKSLPCRYCNYYR